MEEAKKLRPADDVLLTVNFMSSKNALEKLAHTQVGVVCGNTSVNVIACEHHVVVMWPTHSQANLLWWWNFGQAGLTPGKIVASLGTRVLMN